MISGERVLVENMGYVELGELEAELLRLPQVLRLGELKQLSPMGIGVNYSRLTHSLHVYDATKKNLGYNKNTPKEKAKTILAGALLHDVHHGPFSHASQYDGGVSYEEATEYTITKAEVADVLRKHGINPKRVADTVLERVGGYEGQVVCGEIGTDRIVYVWQDLQKFDGIPKNRNGMRDVSDFLLYSIKNVDGNMRLSGESLLPPMYAWLLLLNRTLLHVKYYHGENGRASSTLIRNAIQLANEERLLTGRELFEINDVQMLNKFEKDGGKELRGLVTMIRDNFTPPITAALNVVLKDDCMESVKKLKEDISERLEFEEKVGQGERIFLDISPLAKGPLGDTKLFYHGETMTLSEFGKRVKVPGWDEQRFDMDELKRLHHLNIDNRLMVFANPRADKELIAKISLAELGIDGSKIIPQEQVDDAFPRSNFIGVM
jgi:hypothetical protein